MFVQSATVEPAPQGAGNTAGQGGFGNRRSPYEMNAPKIIPQVTVSVEQYNRMVRMIQKGVHVQVEINLVARYYTDDPMSYNVIAEIPGTDLKDEVVMLGAHLDSWHSGTGATDNAAGSAVCLEAFRIIQALGLKPRRTIRIGLWTGEEEGLLGSRAYVAKHFGERPMNNGQPGELVLKPEHEKFAGYFNLDNGTGKIRGIYLQGNEAVGPIFRAWLAPFRDLGASTITVSNTGGTDHQSFDGVGLPGFQFIQDEIEYNARTHHSNQDVYDRIQADDMKQASLIMASFVYNAATRDEKLPRKPLPAGGGQRRGE
jgi:Zn-dependent M28 family amino/carboxypeptidase